MPKYTFRPRLTEEEITVEAPTEERARNICMERVYGPPYDCFYNVGKGLDLILVEE